MNKKSVNPSKLFNDPREIKMVGGLNLILGLISLGYGMARAMKDQFVVSAGDAALVSFAKVFAVIPFMMFLKILYDGVNKRVNPTQRFYIVTGYFASFFAIFFLLYMMGWIDRLFITGFTDKAVDGRMKSGFFRQCLLALRFWPLLLFYVHAEGIGSFMLSVLGWTYINATMNVKQSKKFYPLISFAAGVSTFLAGLITCSSLSNESMILGIIVSMLLLMVVFYFFEEHKKAHPDFYLALPPKPKKKKIKAGFVESLRMLAGMKDAFYLMLIAFLVIAYASYMPLFESFHKANMKLLGQQEGIRNAVRYYTGVQLQCIGIFSVFTVIVLGPFLRRVSWLYQAFITPAVLFIGTLLFFLCMYFPEGAQSIFSYLPFVRWFGINGTATRVQVFIAIFILMVAKSFKYVVFDSSKERAYVPLDDEQKTSAKSLIDGVLARVAKGGASLYIVVFTSLFSSNIFGIRVPIFIALLLILRR